MNTTMFICMLPQPKQNEIKKLVTRYLKNEGCYSIENIENIMNDRLVNLQCDGFEKQYNKIIKGIK